MHDVLVLLTIVTGELIALLLYEVMFEIHETFADNGTCYNFFVNCAFTYSFLSVFKIIQ